MGGYDPKVIKNREKLHFFFRPPLFLPSLLGKTKEFRCKKRTAFLRTCRHFLTFPSQLPAIFTLVFRKISVVFAQTMDFLETSGLRGKISPLHSLKTSPWSAHKNPLRMRCRGDYSSCLGTDALKDAQRHRSRRGRFAQDEGASAPSFIAKFRALLYRQPASVPTVPHRAQ